ncbi:hypothetical protein CEXT_553561, partial [Caerostris extrusa]
MPQLKAELGQDRPSSAHYTPVAIDEPSTRRPCSHSYYFNLYSG